MCGVTEFCAAHPTEVAAADIAGPQLGAFPTIGCSRRVQHCQQMDTGIDTASPGSKKEEGNKPLPLCPAVGKVGGTQPTPSSSSTLTSRTRRSPRSAAPGALHPPLTLQASHQAWAHHRPPQHSRSAAPTQRLQPGSPPAGKVTTSLAHITQQTLCLQFLFCFFE